MHSNIVAKRYAEALFALVKNNKEQMLEINEILKSLSLFLESVEGKKLSNLFHSPTISPNEKKLVLKNILAQMQAANKTFETFCDLLADKNRLEFLPSIAFCYSNLLDEALNIVRANVCTAIEMLKNEQASLHEALEKQTNKKLELSFTVDPSILGGLVVKFGDTILDASLKASLNGLRESIKRGE